MKENDTQRVDIRTGLVELFDFRGQQTPTPSELLRLQLIYPFRLFEHRKFGDPGKVAGEFDFPEQYFVSGDISVDHGRVVHFFEAEAELGEQLHTLYLVQPPLPDQLLERLAGRRVLINHVELALSFENITCSLNVRMALGYRIFSLF